MRWYGVENFETQTNRETWGAETVDSAEIEARGLRMGYEIERNSQIGPLGLSPIPNHSPLPPSPSLHHSLPLPTHPLCTHYLRTGHCGLVSNLSRPLTVVPSPAVCGGPAIHHSVSQSPSRDLFDLYYTG